MSKIQAIRGMNDILPDEAERWLHFESIIRDWLASYGYRHLRTPIVEKTELFKRSIGEVTDIVEKEMYTFVDGHNGDSLTMRPEGTAACVRAVLEHNLLYNAPQRLWYMGPMFRHERPQKGRYRQFHQVGVESLGYAGPDMDAEHIVMTAALWKKLGLEGVRLELNTLGSSDERARYRDKLTAYLEQHLDLLDEDSRRRLHSNPLRVLDSKNPAMQEMINAAPRLMDELGEESLKHFDALRGLLQQAGVAYSVNHRLVRGLDYYNLTVFEWVTDQLGAQGTVCAGGRYDGLIGQIGGKPAPACGYAMGVERLLALLEESGALRSGPSADAYVVHAGEAATALAWQAAQRLRDAGLNVILHAGGGNFSAQMKKAAASGARCAVLLGDNEAATGQLTIKNLATGTQTTIELAAAADLIRSARPN